MSEEELTSDIIYYHPHHPHIPKHPNHIHKEQINNGGFNQKIAVSITKATGTMWAAYIFMILALIGFPALAQWLGPLVAIYVIWLSQTFIQLTMLPILSVGQNVLSKHQEIQSDEMFKTTQKSFHDVEHIIKHLDAQDKELLRQTMMIKEVQERIQSTNQYTSHQINDIRAKLIEADQTVRKTRRTKMNSSEDA